MKRLILSLSIAFACSLVWAGQVVVVVVQPVASSCATTDTAIGHDEFLEGFQAATTGVNDGNAWTVTQAGTTANINVYFDSSSLTTNKPVGACDRSYRLVVPDAAGTETYVQWNKGSEIDLDTVAVDVVVYIYVSTAQDVGEEYTIFSVHNSGQSLAAEIKMRNSSGNTQVQAAGSSASTYTTISTGQWVKLTLHLDTTGASSSLSINDGGASTFTRIASRDFQHIRAGAPAGLDVGDSGTIDFDLICANSP